VNAKVNGSNGAAALGNRNRRIGIIGGGPGGLCVGIKLKEAGYENFTIFEKSAGVGGTWYNNRYPGLSCDVPSHLYSFSFELNPTWSRAYAPQPEILSYMQRLADKYGLMPHVRLSTRIKAAHWDDECTVWRLVLENGDVETFDLVVGALGMFNDLKWPDIPGLHDFQGTLFHSGQWDEAHAFEGETVGVIGSAASAVQFIPRIAPRVAKLEVFQRNPPWVLPKDDPIFDEATLAERRADPMASRAVRLQLYRNMEQFVDWTNPASVPEMERVARENLQNVTDPAIRQKLTPNFSWGCSRPLFSNEFYPTFNRPNVELVTERIERITQSGIITHDGQEHRFDTIVCATGYEVQRYLTAIDVTGRNGLALKEAWKDGAEAYLGITTAGFPNLFMIYGPNTNNGSILFMLECQANYFVRRLQWMDQNEIAWIDVRPEIMKSFNEDLQSAINRIDIWRSGCNNYYATGTGRIVTQYPHNMSTYRAHTMTPDWDAFEIQYGAPLSR
jgi:cation diffusion facilitator CzcD-associated flavoprotein CzcO